MSLSPVQRRLGDIDSYFRGHGSSRTCWDIRCRSREVSISIVTLGFPLGILELDRKCSGLQQVAGYDEMPGNGEQCCATKIWCVWFCPNGTVKTGSNSNGREIVLEVCQQLRADSKINRKCSVKVHEIMANIEHSPPHGEHRLYGWRERALRYISCLLYDLIGHGEATARPVIKTRL